MVSKKSPKKAKAPAKPVAKKTSTKSSATPIKAKKGATKAPIPVAPITTGKVKKPLFPIHRNRVPTAKKPELAEGKTTKTSLGKKFLEQQKKHLLDLRDHILDQMQGVAHDSLRSRGDDGGSSAFGMHQADAGSDAYEKDFALSLLSQEQDALYEVEEALKRIENSTYGICEMSGESIPPERLEAIPFARYTVECQSKFEKENKDKNRWDTSPQFMDSAENFFEEEEEGEEEDKTKAKE